MKRLFALSLLCVLAAWGLSIHGVKAQQGAYGFVVWQPSGYVCPWPDSFTGAASAALAPSWINANASNSSAFQQTGGGAVQENTLSSHATAVAYRTNCPFISNGQYAQATVAANASTGGYVGLGVAVSSNGNTGYYFRGNGNSGTSMTIYSLTGESSTSLTTCSVTVPTGAVMKFVLTGASAPYTLTVYKNGSSVCSTTSSLYSGTNGFPAMYISSDGTSLADQELSTFSGE